MALPSNVGFGTIVGRLIDSTGAALEGQVEFVPSPKRLLNPTADPSPVIILPKPVVTTLVEGALTQVLVATDDQDNNPHGWTYNVRFKLSGASLDSFDIEVPEGATIDLATVVPVSSGNGTHMIRGAGVVPGGTTGQVLVKASGDDYDTEWATMSGTGAPAVALGDGVESATFWGVFTEGSEPTPPNDGGVHYGFRVTA